MSASVELQQGETQVAVHSKEQSIQNFFDELRRYLLSKEFSKETSPAVVLALAKALTDQLESYENIYRLISHHMGTLVLNIAHRLQAESLDAVLVPLAQYWQEVLGVQSVLSDLELSYRRAGYPKPKM